MKQGNPPKNTTLKAAIALTGKTQAQVADEAHIPPSYLSEAINFTRTLKADHVKAVCVALNSTPRKLGLA